MSGLCSGLSYPLDMEQNPAIDEAWLNHEGTVYAIVCIPKEEERDFVKPRKPDELPYWVIVYPEDVPTG